MSFVSVATDAVAEAARTLQGIGSGLGAATAAAATPTTGIAAAAQDEVSAAIAGLMGNFGQEFQAINTQMQAFHDRFVSALGASIGQYASAEATNAQQLLLNAVSGAGFNPTASVAAAALSLGDTPFSFNVLNYPTPLGPITLTLYGEQSLLGTVTVTSGTLLAPPLYAFGFEAISPFMNVGSAFTNGGAAFTSAVRAGDGLAAATALVQTPVNAVTGFFVGTGEITGSEAVPAYTGYSGVDYRIPVGGLFAPVQPVTLTLHGSDGTVSTIPLSGTQFGGLFPNIVRALTGF